MLLEKDGIPYLSFARFESAGPIVHGFLGRAAGVSATAEDPPGPGKHRVENGAQKNPGAGGTGGTEGTEGTVATGYENIERAFGLPPGGPVTVNQVHGNSVYQVEDTLAGGPVGVEADAIVTRVAGVAIGVLTADCLPILLFDPVKKAAGAVHAGWRGTVERVAQKAVEALTKRFGSRPGDVHAALGPSIGRCCYRVNAAVTKNFRNTFGACREYLSEGPDPKLDIRGANLEQLLQSGLEKDNISSEDICTSCMNGFFFSYRKEGEESGRQMSFVMIR
jgi:YfiH family protein